MRDIGAELYSLVEVLYPICRSITGDGVRETLAVLATRIPLRMHEVPTGTPVFDWTVPKEWNVRDAYVKDAKGRRVVDFRASNLHVVNYSVPVRRRMPLAELKKHLFSMPDRPDWIPYRTSYYSESWGFCLTHNQLLALQDGEYEVCIDSTLAPGHLTYGEYVVPGETDEEMLVYSHLCHPSLCNDNLSGLAVSTFLAEHLASRRNRHTYRFVFGPGTIGSIAWLSRNEDKLARIRHGLVVALVGDRGRFTYKKTRGGDADVDHAVVRALKASGREFAVEPFSPYGYDERQFCSPGIDLPVGRISRSPNGSYPEYHTSADNLDFVSAERLAETYQLCLDAFDLLERDVRYVNTVNKGEPQLGRRGLYAKHGGGKNIAERQYAMLWVLNLSDGEHGLLGIAERSGLPPAVIAEAARDLAEAGLLVPAAPRGKPAVAAPVGSG
jgi:aminopeptidase-like protein